MKLIKFKEHNVVFAEDQPKYVPLPAHKKEDGEIICCWKLSFLERLSLAINGKIWHSILTFNHPLQPQLLQTNKPKMG